ncbi:MAG: SDR family oxidoreductase [Spirochaetales bacterium]|nr:SDR family oxidoreductase [Spirochaetales bacterium]
MVTGASGLLGRSLMTLLTSRGGYTVTGIAYNRAKEPLLRLDLTDEGKVYEALGRYRPEVVLHLAAERRPEAVDAAPDRSYMLNVAATQYLARACAAHGAFFLLISTDYVYDGTTPPYYPHSPVNPLNTYGRMKLEAELAAETALAARLMHEGKKSFGAVLRIPLLYGPVERIDECSVTDLAKYVLAKTPAKVEHWAKRYPVHVDDVSDAILKVVSACIEHPGAYGAFPRFLLSGEERLTKYEMVLCMARATGRDASHIQPDPAPPAGAPRPRDCLMDTSALKALGWRQSRRFEESMGEILAPWLGVIKG